MTKPTVPTKRAAPKPLPSHDDLRAAHARREHDKVPAFGCPRCIAIRGPMYSDTESLCANVARLADELATATEELKPTSRNKRVLDLAEHVVSCLDTLTEELGRK